MGDIQALPRADRPRERLKNLGAEALSDAELLAVLLGSGGSGNCVMQIAGALLQRFGDLEGLGQAALSEITDPAGMGEARACLVGAAFELGRRVTGNRPHAGRRLARSTEVWSHLRARLAHKPVEEFWALGLDVRHRVQFEACMARGCLTGVEVHPRDIFRQLIREGVAAVIFCHNHPSGDPTPSRDDLELTRRLRQVGKLCGISVLDHVVVAREGFISIADRGWC